MHLNIKICLFWCLHYYVNQWHFQMFLNCSCVATLIQPSFWGVILKVSGPPDTNHCALYVFPCKAIKQSTNIWQSSAQVPKTYSGESTKTTRKNGCLCLRQRMVLPSEEDDCGTVFKSAGLGLRRTRFESPLCHDS